MTEWEKLQTGQLYNDFDRGLFKRRIAAKRLFRAYNRTDDDEQTERRALMEQLAVWLRGQECLDRAGFPL